MDTPKSLRQRAEQWRSLAGYQCNGTADALLEAACELELRAHRLERAPRAPVEAAEAQSPKSA
jgi:hypothetical protein